MVVIGLTGGIASGKTTAADFLEDVGAPVVRSDRLARDVVAPGEPALAEIVAAWPGVMTADGTLDRKALGRIIFAQPAERRRLEAITHPRIHRRMQEWLDAQRRAGAPAAVCDIPLLFEAGYDRRPEFLHRIWVVRCEEATQLRRLMARDGLAEGPARQRLAAQWPLSRKVPGADLVLENDGAPENLRAQVVQAWQAVLGSAPA